MARPNSPAAIQAHVKGLREAKAAFTALPQDVRDLMNDATDTTISEIRRQAKAHLQSSPSIRTRALFNHIEAKMNRKTGRGRVGVSMGSTVIRPTGQRAIRVRGIIVPGRGGGARGARIDKPSRRAHFVEFGTKSMPAEPFMIPATQTEKGPYLQRCRAAGRLIERKAAQRGGGRHL